jgi:LacI family repressor for deo operon, udp, cdd, tsx, nupC, and nupG
MNMRPPKMKDIALKLGVSPATVSRALSGTGLVAEPTLSRIREAAEAMDYRPNVSARNLRRQSSMTVLMVVRDIGNPFYLEVMKGLEAAAREAGYAVLMGNTENDPEREAEYFAMLRDGNADGMVLMTGKLPSSRFRLDKLPVVVALERIEGSTFPHVEIDNHNAAREAVRHLISLGHRRIAHIAGPLAETMAIRRRDGYRAAMAEAGIAVPEGYEETGDYLLQGGRDGCRALMARADAPTAIFCANDEMAFGAIHELRRSGRDVPRDVSVVGFDDIYLSQAIYPPLTTVSQPRAEIGRRAMDVLLGIMAGGKPPESPLMMPTTLMLRESTAPAREFEPLRG